MKKSRENSHIFKSRAPYPLPGPGDKGGEAEGCSLHHHNHSPHSVWNKFNSSPGKKPSWTASCKTFHGCSWEWQQPLGELEAPALEAAADFEGERAAPHFCQPWLPTHSKIYQGLLHSKSLENISMSAKSLATAAFSGGITIVRSLNHCRSGAAELHTNLFIN